jgi:uncharacterized OB-fold protein
MTRVARRPALYTLPDSRSELPLLRGGRCAACGYLFFPMHRYGCESCGEGPERIEEELLPGTGTLRSFAVVHRHPGAEPAPPFAVGVIGLDRGPEIEAILESDDPSGWRIGSPMRATLVAIRRDEEGREVVDCRFASANGEAET